MATIRHRRRLGRELARLREERGLSQDQVARALGWKSRPTVGRIELAQTKDIAEQVAQLLDLYKVNGADRERLLQLAQSSPAAGWWTAYNDVFSSTYVELEDGAARILNWQDAVVPGLLQTPDYARAVITSVARLHGDDDDYIERRVRARMLRRTLLDRDRPPHLHAVLDEAVLHRQTGGPEVMRGQLVHLDQMAQRPNVTIQIVPFSADAHPGTDGRFVLLCFDDGDPDLPYVEGQGGAVYLEAPGEVERLTLAWDCVTRAALSVEDSLAVLARLAKEV